MEIPKLEFKDLIIRKASSAKSIEELIKLIGAGGKNSVVQIFDPNAIATSTQLIGAYANTHIAFKNHTNKTRSMSMEMLLFSAMTDQIDEAIELAGAKRTSEFIIFSDSKEAFARIKKALKTSSDFKSDLRHASKVAKSLKISAKSIAKIDAAILQRMAISRLSSD